MREFLNLILEPLYGLFEEFQVFAPNLLAMLVIFVFGILLARLLRAALVKFLTAVKFDNWSDRMGFTTLMRKGDMWVKPSSVLGAIIFWMLVIVTLMVGLAALKVAAINNLVHQFFGYLPRVFSAVVILVVGYIVASFVSRAVLIGTANSGYHYAKLVAEAVRVLLIVMIVAMVMEQLQIATNIVLAAFSIVFGGIVAALAIAFGVGGIGAAKRVIEREIDEDRSEKPQGGVEHL